MENSTTNGAVSLEERVEHGYADNNGVKIHYASVGSGPLMVMVHGFPDYWYTWHNQMATLSANYQTVALDLRGYNLSDKPQGVENYNINLLIEDVAAVIRHLGQEKAIIVGHDWGGWISWHFAMHKPEMTERLIILNLPHPRGIHRELVHNPQQRANSQYARNFQMENSHLAVPLEALSAWIKDPAERQKHAEAMQRSYLEGMMNIYKANYPREPYTEDSSPLIKVQAPVLMFHGLKDKYLLPGALNNTWEWVEKDLTLVTVPNADHFVQHDAADFVTSTIKCWLSH